MSSIESSNVRVERDIGDSSVKQPEKQPRETKASATPKTAGDSMNDLMTLRRQRPAGEEPPAAHAPDADAPQKSEGRRSSLRSNLRRGLSSDAMQVFQMVLQTENNSRQVMQQAVDAQAQASNSMAEGLEKAAR